MGDRRDILFISSNFPPVIGGSMVVYDQICRAAADRVVALAPARDYRTGAPWPRLDDNRPYITHRIPYVRPPLPRDPPSIPLATILTDLGVMARLLVTVARLWARHRFTTVCLGELVQSGWLVFPLRYLLGLRVIFYTHGEEVSQAPQSLLERLRPLFLRHAHRIIAVSQFCKGEIVSQHGIAPDHIELVSNGVDLTRFRPGPPEPSALPEGLSGRRLLLSVSRLVRRKGHADLIRALPAIVARHPDIHCLIVGDGPEAGPLQEMITSFGLQAYCSLLGPVPFARLIALYRSAELFVLPCQTQADGDTEGFGLVFVEANACGLPVVGGAAGGTIEALVDGETGLLVDGADPDDIAGAVNRLLEDPVLAGQLAEGGRQRAARMGWPQVAERFLEACLAPPRHEPPAYPQARASRADFGTEATVPPPLLVTVDVEEEFAWDSFSRAGYTVPSVAGLRLFHRDIHALGIRPVYLLTYPLLRDAAHREFCREILAQGTGEVGIHLHSWVTPPFWEQPNRFTSFQCNLPDHVERRKLETLCAAYEEAFACKPRIHRAGRWGGNARSADLLEALGLTIDLSASAGFADTKEGAPDFSALDGRPFWSGRGGNVLAIPASSLRLWRGPHWLSIALSNLAYDGPLATVGKPVRLSPEEDSQKLLTDMLRILAQRRRSAVVTLHSSSLSDGGSPYVLKTGGAEVVRQRCVQALGQALARGWFTPSSCVEIEREARLARARCAQSARV